MNCTESEYIETITELHKIWTPHPKQIQIGRALIVDGYKEIFINAGRNLGKTEMMAYLLWRWARLNPGSENYYFAPYMKQAREILWSSQRVQRFGPQSWLTGPPNNTEMRITFKNGSFIKLDGSDNVEAYRGVKPKGLSVFDEFKDFRPEFYEAYDPNRAAHNAPLVIIGTPPDRECQFTDLMKDFQTNPKKAFFHAPTKDNPYISKEWLENKKKELLARGDEDQWMREYEAVFIKGGKAKIFPMLTNKHTYAHDSIINEIARDRRKLEWYAVADPAAISVFAVIFAAVNPYTRQIYLLDEIYETEQALMTTRVIGQRIITKMNELYPAMIDSFNLVYDEAEAWFSSEMQDKFGLNWLPTHKSQHKKESGISLIKDLLLSNKIKISDRCVKTFWEMDNYFKDKNGKIPKVNDHIIDTIRYLLSAAGYTVEESEEKKEKNDENFRGTTIDEEFAHEIANMEDNYQDL